MNRPIILRSLAIGGAVTHDRRHSPVSPDPRVAGGATVLEPRPVGMHHEGGSDEEHGGPSRRRQSAKRHEQGPRQQEPHAQGNRRAAERYAGDRQAMGKHGPTFYPVVVSCDSEPSTVPRTGSLPSTSSLRSSTPTASPRSSSASLVPCCASGCAAAPGR